ncbi:calbindin-32 [Eurytemora carolleeae]|uniref:calbindin-32 n=1 Tax=Eurytemora carolleeae TaxID=1294199 RepID=UPI000C75E7D4|nr:calbindin-32 [Eurytemora carolleeae]|eukprot:XP_023319523.1 calbindin-32-like [Eurytemora affinis]
MLKQKGEMNFLHKFCDDTLNLQTLTANQFFGIWEHYDTDGNGFIEENELVEFLREFIDSVSSKDELQQISDSEIENLKEMFLETYDTNKDGRIDIRELAQLLPMEENFLLLFRFDNPLDSSVEFMKIWNEYDSDGSGFLEANELKNFLRDLLRTTHRGQGVHEDQLIMYTDVMLQMFDSNKDGKLQLSEMSQLLPVKENFLTRQMFTGTNTITREDIEHVFALYDRDCNGYIENDELTGFLKDMLELIKKDYDCTDISDFYDTIMKGCDTNRDGRVSKKELTMVLLAISQI